MFRPSPDPEITDHEAEITFPTILNRFLMFDNRVHIVEYDWGNTSNHIGRESEFVILGKGSTVGINSIISNDDYFKGLIHWHNF